MNNNDYDIVKAKMESEQVEASDRLSEEKVAALLNEDAQKDTVIKMKTGRKTQLRRAVALVACLAIFAGVFAFAKGLRAPKTVPTETEKPVLENIVYFKDYSEIDALLKENNKKSLKETVTEMIDEVANSVKGFVAKNDGGARYAASDAKSTESFDMSGMGAADGATATAPKSYSQTYRQVDAVDEGDIVKTDGEYIYYIPVYDNTVKIYKAENGKATKVASIHAEDGRDYWHEIYIDGDTLILVGSKTVYNEKSRFYGKTHTFTRTYNIADRSNPQLTYEYKQSGNYSSSRKIGDYVYVVSNHSPMRYYGYIDYARVKGDVVINDGATLTEDTTGEKDTTASQEEEQENGNYPECGSKDMARVPIGDICGVPTATEDTYCVVSAVNVKDSSGSKVKTKAFLGATDNMYCNEKNLYLAASIWHYDEGYRYSVTAQTQIIRYAFDKEKIEVTGSAIVDGTVNNQYSMDEYDGYFRIATTSSSSGDKQTNNLFVLDKSLKETGKVTGYAKDESIRAVRYMGKTAYVITFEQTDPLFVIDLTDPKKPEIKGEVKLDGFSTSLTPFGENLLLGVGNNTEEGEWGIVTEGMKIVLFDVSDPAKPKTVSEEVFKTGESPAQYNPRAITLNPDKGYAAIPFTRYHDNEDYERESVGALLMRVRDGKLVCESLENREKSEDTDISRCVYIDEDLYVLDTEGTDIFSFTVK